VWIEIELTPREVDAAGGDSDRERSMTRR
jgi:hypothetical protein